MPHLQGSRADGPQVIDFIAEQRARAAHDRQLRVALQVELVAELRILRHELTVIDGHVMEATRLARVSA